MLGVYIYIAIASGFFFVADLWPMFLLQRNFYRVLLDFALVLWFTFTSVFRIKNSFCDNY